MFDLTTYLPYLLNRAGVAVTVAFADALAEESLTVPAWLVLAVLLRDERVRIGELADHTSIEFSTLSRLVDTLQRRGLVTRRAAKDDARVVNVSLTTRGRAVATRLLPAATALEERLLVGMTETEIADLRRLLHRVYANINQRAALV